jgi:hypothetical protein
MLSSFRREPQGLQRYYITEGVCVKSLKELISGRCKIFQCAHYLQVPVLSHEQDGHAAILASV